MKPQASGNISTQLRQLHQAVASLRPSSTPGIITTHTTHGVTRKPTDSLLRRRRTSTVARWA